MTDYGTTATQVSPVVKENEMSTIRDLFERSANAIVQASELARTVNELQLIVNDLKRDVEKVRDQNKWLDEQLANVRQGRDKALDELASANNKAHTLEMAMANLETISKDQAAIISRLQDQLTQTQKERDAYAIADMESTEELGKTKDTLDKLRAVLGIVATPKPEPIQAVVYDRPTGFGPVEQIKPEPAPEVNQSASQEPVPTPKPSPYSTSPIW